jgi:hypothetical protein
LECFVALLLPCFAEICNTKASKIKQSVDSHFTAYPDQTKHKLLAAVQTTAPVHHSPSKKNTQRPEANHLIVEYPEDKHRFTAYPDHFLSLITTIRQKKTKLGIGSQFLPSSRQERSRSGENDFLICWRKGKGKRGRESGTGRV